MDVSSESWYVIVPAVKTFQPNKYQISNKSCNECTIHSSLTGHILLEINHPEPLLQTGKRYDDITGTNTAALTHEITPFPAGANRLYFISFAWSVLVIRGG